MLHTRSTQRVQTSIMEGPLVHIQVHLYICI